MPRHPILDATRDLQPLISEHRPESDRQANLTREVLDACGEAGLFRMAAPREVGGLELLPRDVVTATQNVSRADPAVGWYALNSMAASFLAAFVGEEEGQALFEDPNANFGFAFMPGGKATPVQGGYRLSGFWPVMTGGGSAKWATVAGHVMDGDAPREIDGIPDAREFLVQTKDLQFKNTWQDVSAMRGTGSNAFSGEDLFVPEGLVVAPNDPPRINRPYFRAPVVFHILPSDFAVILGIVESVLDSIIPASSKQKAAVTGERRRDQAATQELIVECTYMFRSAQAVLREVTDLASRRIEKGEEIGAKQRAELYAISTQIFDVGRKLASELFAGGTRRCLERVVTAELDYVEGLAWLTLLYADQYHHHWDEPDQGYDSRARAVRHGERAVALDDGNPRARAHPGFAVFVSGERGIAEMNRVVELNPNN